MRCTVFVGPSAGGLDLSGVVASDVDVRPPACRGSIWAVLRSGGTPGAIAIVDGVFQNAPSIGHREILDALEAGWQVWGLSSLGAIRAAEMDHLGMRGFGSVYARFRDDPDLPDDEVALLHGPGPEWRPMSEPLVHLREAAADLAGAGILDRAEADEVAGCLAARWFAERNIPALVDLAEARAADGRRPRVRSHLRDFDRFRLKRRDLLQFLREAPWQHP